MHSDNNYSYYCRVCGMKQSFQPWGEDKEIPTFEICGCCGVQYGYEDCSLEKIKEFRHQWIESGTKWFCPKEKPENWSLEEQIENIPDEFL